MIFIYLFIFGCNTSKPEVLWVQDFKKMTVIYLSVPKNENGKSYLKRDNQMYFKYETFKQPLDMCYKKYISAGINW